MILLYKISLYVSRKLGLIHDYLVTEEGVVVYQPTEQFDFIQVKNSK